ncbi:MAG: hypothetical protein CMO55_09690 [Verrucomicrobiales bacterium]|nr:hypothetical protein [Verrucomicrobiales bacterium]
MKCLWLTRKYPRPTNSGELIYSNGLIRSFAAQPVDLTVIAHDNDEVPVGNGSTNSQYKDQDGVEWLLGTPRLGSRLGSLVSRFPSDTWRLKNGGPEALLDQALDQRKWDAVIIDHAAIGWALGPLMKLRMSAGEESPRLVYVSHNHEAKVRREVANNSTAGYPKKMLLKHDAEKYAHLEDELCRHVDLVTAITRTEVDAYRANFPNQKYLCLTPGYEGPIHTGRSIDEKTPRRLVMSGSFEWIAKRINLEIFLEKAAAKLADADIELQIVGKTDEEFRLAMKRRFPDVDFVGRVPEMEPYLLNSRMGLIVEEFGGGFKLKQLEYVFHGLPIAGLTCAVDGLPLSSPEQILLESTTEELMVSVIKTIDDLGRLNQMSQDSLQICQEEFRWADRGKRLFESLSDLRSFGKEKESSTPTAVESLS